MYQWLKGESLALPVTFFIRPDGTAAVNLWEMDGLLAPHQLQLCGRNGTGHHVRRVPMLAHPEQETSWAASWHGCTHQCWGSMAGAWQNSGPSRISPGGGSWRCCGQ